MAAPLGMLTSLTLCAQHGILVKDGRALEIMRKVDTVLFDKTGTLTREKPEVGRIICCKPYTEKISSPSPPPRSKNSPIPSPARSSKNSRRSSEPLPPIDDSKYQVGYGITVEIEGKPCVSAAGASWRWRISPSPHGSTPN